MSAFSDLPEATYVVLRLGDRRFALPANRVEELTSAGRLDKFPHRTPGVEGVIVRRRRILAVRDVASLLMGRALLVHRFYLIVRRHYGAQLELEALPVSGDCELVGGVIPLPRGDEAPEYFAGRIDLAGEQIPLLDVDKLATAAPQAAELAGSRA
jgi:chemotaxis signal transduction protein